MKRINIRFDDKTYEKLLALKKQNSSNINALVNSAVLSFLDKEKDENFLSDNATKKLNHKIQILLSDDEYNLLKENAKKHGFRSVKSECRFQVINSLYDENFLTNADLNDFKVATSSLNKVSKDLWHFIKLEKEMRTLDFKEQFKGYEPIFNEIRQAIESYKKGLDIVSKKTQKRM